MLDRLDWRALPPGKASEVFGLLVDADVANLASFENAARVARGVTRLRELEEPFYPDA